MYNQVLLSGKLGDGCIVRRSETSNATISFNAKHINYLLFKKKELDKIGIDTGGITYGRSGYKKTSIIPKFMTKIDTRITKVSHLSKIECIQNLNKLGLIMLYLDDGAYHKSHNTGHLYVNTFNEEELQALITKIYELYPIKKCTIQHDNKKDGRSYPYLYIPVNTMKSFKEDVKKFLEDNNIDEMLYKVGLPSTTISNESTLK